MPLDEVFIEPIDFVALWERLKKSQNILQTLHPNADPDSICSNYSMMHLLQGAGIKNLRVTLISGDNFNPANFEYLSEFTKHIELCTFDEVLTPFDTLLALDIPRPDRVSSAWSGMTENEKFDLVNLDHHAGNSFVSSANTSVFLDVNASSTCEMVFRLAQANGLELDDDCLRAIFVGIWSDTQGFCMNTSPWTLLIASYIKSRVEVDSLIDRLEKCWTQQDLIHLKEVIPLYTVEEIAGVSVGVLVCDTNAVDIIKLLDFFSLQQQQILVVCTKGDSYRIAIKAWTEKKKAYGKKIAEGFGGSGHANRAGAKETEIKDMVEMKYKIFSVIRAVLSE